MIKKRVARALGAILSLALMITMVAVPSMTARAAEDGVDGFVNRCYRVALGREADPDGFADWTGKLLNGEMDGATVAWGFVFSPEYINANKSNGDFVTDMYTLFLGRTPDEAGYNDWKGQLDAGADKQAIFYGFANSVEFFNICTEYGVTAGYFTTDYDKNQVNAVNMFVARMYKVCFNRLGDQVGQADWCNRLLKGELTGIDCANGFINSAEYQNLNLSNEDYVKNMYRAFMGRECDEEGFKDWVSKLYAGYTRDEIFAGFANSSEFQSICDSYGITRGDYEATDIHPGVIVPNNTTETNESDGEQPSAAETADTDANKVWMLSKKTYSNGQYTLYTYKDNGGQVATRYAADGHELGVESKYLIYSEKTYESSIRNFDDDGNVTFYSKGIYSKRNVTDSGYVLSETCYYNPNSGDVSGYMDMTYEKRGESYVMTGYKSYSLGGGDGRTKVLSAYMKAEINDKGQTTRSAYYDANNVLTAESLSTFDTKGNEKENIFISYANDGSVQYKNVTKSEYNGPNGSLSKKTQYNASGAKISDTVYEYDKYGNVIKETVTAADGSVTWTKMEYK